MQSGFLLPCDRISFLLDLWVLERGTVACNTHEFNFRHGGRKSGRFRSGQDIDFVDPKNWIETKGAVHLQPTWCFSSVQFSSVAQSCPTLCDPVNHSTPGLPVHHQLPEFTQTHAHWVDDAIQPSHPLSSPSPPAPNPSQHQGLFRWVSSSHEVAKVLKFQLQHQSFQWTPRTDLL